MQLYLRRTGTLNLHYLVVEKCVIKILSFFLVVMMHSKDLYLLSVLLLVMAGNVCKEICSIPLYIPDLFQYSYEKKVIQRHGQKKRNHFLWPSTRFLVNRRRIINQ